MLRNVPIGARWVGYRVPDLRTSSQQPRSVLIHPILEGYPMLESSPISSTKANYSESYYSASGIEQSYIPSNSTAGRLPSLVGSSLLTVSDSDSSTSSMWNNGQYLLAADSSSLFHDCIFKSINGCRELIYDGNVKSHTESHFQGLNDRPGYVECQNCGRTCSWKAYPDHILEHSATPCPPKALVDFLKQRGR
jgi:hypothetical protein